MDDFLLGLGAALGTVCRQFYRPYLPRRTIREFVLGVMIVPVVLSMLWFSTFGGSAIHFELFQGAGIADAVAQEVPAGLLICSTSCRGVPTPPLAVVLVCIFVVTSADSATFVLGMFTSKGVLNPTRFVRVLWGVLQLLMAGVLLLSGGLRGCGRFRLSPLFRSCC